MRPKVVLMVLVSVFLLSAIFGLQFIAPVVADPAIIRVPEDYPTIQEAINAANPGDIVEVASGTYYEHVIINKSVSLIGENKSTAIIDGNWTGTVLNIAADNVEIAGFTIQNGSRHYGDGSEYGILVSSSNNKISGNIFLYNDVGILLYYSSGNTISDNTISVYGWGGIVLEWSYDNVIKDNEMDGGGGLAQVGVGLYSSSHNVISGNTILNNGYYGINLFQSQLNKIIGNNIINNRILGVRLSFTGNTFYHNNFINNGAGGDRNTWDNGAEGNYWSDYNGIDRNGDGIGDTPYIIDEKNQDNYPLMAPWNELRIFNIPWEEEVYQVTTLSNSTIASFNFSHSDKQISFNVTGPPGTSGFCNITIPKAILGANETHPWQVLLDGNPINYTKVENTTHISIYFTYTHSTRHVQIIGTWVTPEFPTALILPLLIITALLATILRKMIQPARKLHHHANSTTSQ